MDLKSAVNRANENKEIMRMIGKGFALASCVGVSNFPDLPSKWIVSYHHPEKAKAESSISCTVGDDSLAVGGVSEPTSVPENFLDLSEARVWEKDAMEKALASFREGRNVAHQIIMSLHKGAEKAIWTINFITLDLAVVTVRISAATGELLDKKESSLVHPG